jgi:hypothetical protein
MTKRHDIARIGGVVMHITLNTVTAKDGVLHVRRVIYVIPVGELAAADILAEPPNCQACSPDAQNCPSTNGGPARAGVYRRMGEVLGPAERGGLRNPNGANQYQREVKSERSDLTSAIDGKARNRRWQVIKR